MCFFRYTDLDIKSTLRTQYAYQPRIWGLHVEIFIQLDENKQRNLFILMTDIFNEVFSEVDLHGCDRCVRPTDLQQHCYLLCVLERTHEGSIVSLTTSRCWTLKP
jgi:hypothetical protein